MYRGMGAGDAIDYKAPWATAWYCNRIFSGLIPECTPPTAAQIAADTSGYGGSLSDESKAAATAMAQSAIAADIEANPCRYSDIDAGAAATCNPQSSTDFTMLALVVGGIALFKFLKG